MTAQKDVQPQNEGEGSRTAAKQYNEATRKFVESGKVDKAAKMKAERTPRRMSRNAKSDLMLAAGRVQPAERPNFNPDAAIAAASSPNASANF
mgnify:CR=1 FL=1